MRFKSPEKKKINNKKGLWSPDEDQKLRDYIENHGIGCWSSVPFHAGLQRSGKSCRLRWINYLRPGLKRGNFTLQEETIILTLHGMLGNKWSQMSQHLPGRTDNEIKNHWHSHLKKQVEHLKNIKSQEIFYDTQNKDMQYGTLIDSNLKSNEVDFPKILFADWLSLDQFHKLEISCTPKTVKNGELLYEGSFSSVIQEGSSYGLASSVDNLHLKYEHRHVGSDFCDLISEDNMCQNFSINSDVTLYSCYDL